MRNVEKTIASTNVNVNYDMTCGELRGFLERMKNEDPVTFIGDVFKFGYAVGQRALKKEMEIQNCVEKAV